MNTLSKNQQGFAHLFLIIIAVVVVLGVLGFVAYRAFDKENYTAENSEQKAKESPVTIKSLPFEFGPFDPVTKRAGDFQFIDKPMPEGTQPVLFSEFGYVSPGNSSNNYQSKISPQPTVYLVAGTKIKAMIDGTVLSVIKLYSGDYSIHMTGAGSELIFEHEHVIDPQVKEGDEVKAGTVIATASDVDASKVHGLSIFEMGILKGGNPPMHLCMFDYLDASIKDKTLSDITAFKVSWEEFRGDTSIYDEANTALPGCINREPVTDNNNSSTGRSNDT